MPRNVRGRGAALLLLAMLLMLLPQAGASAEGLTFDRISYRDGLVSSSVSSIVQDHDGFLWLGSQAGLHRYDGHSMRVFESVPFNPESLAHQLVQTLHIGDDDYLWIGTYGGLSRLDLETETITHYRHDGDDPESLSNNVVTAIEHDADGRLWVGTLDGLNRLECAEEGRFTRFSPTDEARYALPHATVRALLRDSEDRLWVGTLGGLARVFDRSNGSARFYLRAAGPDRPEEVPARLSDSAVMAVTEGPHGRLWVGTWGGELAEIEPHGGLRRSVDLGAKNVYQLLANGRGEVFVATWGQGLVHLDAARGDYGDYTVYRHRREDPQSLAHDVVYSLFEDRSGIIWIGTNGNGVSKYHPGKREFRYIHPHLPEHRRISGGRVRVLYQDTARGELYIGLYGGGLNVRDPDDGTIRVYRHDPEDPASISHDTVNAVLRDRETHLLVATHGGLDRFYPAEGRFESAWGTFAEAPADSQHRQAPGRQIPDRQVPADPPIVYSLLRAGDGSLWVGTHDEGLFRLMPDGRLRRYRYDPEADGSLSDNLVYDVFEDSTGVIWVGTNNGLNRYRPAADDFVRYRHDPNDRDSISNNSVGQILEDSFGRVWAATRAGGLVRYHRDRDAFSHITTSDGLSSNAVTAVLESAPGVFYVATNAGMNRVFTDLMRVTQLDERDGLRTPSFSTGATVTAGGDLLFGAFSEVVRIPRLRTPRPGSAPPVQITAINVMSEPYESSTVPHRVDALELVHTENSVGFEFAALEFSLPERNRYRYRLRGLNDDWVEAGYRRFVEYTGLPPGSYTFEVSAADSRGIWSTTPARVALTITPPFWRTPAFVGVLLVAAAVAIWAVLQLRTRALRLQTQRLERQVSERTAELARANSELNAANATKDRFLSILAHDLRGPIGGLRSVMEPVVEEFEEFSAAELHEISTTVLESAGGLESMLENLLEWAQVQSGRLQLVPEELEVCELVQTVLHAHRGTARGKQIELSTDCGETGAIHVRADRYMLKTVLVNLVNNALKYTPRGGAVSVSVEPEGTELRIVVRDTGVGIPEDKLALLFEGDEIYRTRGTEGEKGSGLGLRLCSELAELSGARLTVESGRDAGTTVAFVLPKFDAALRSAT